MTRFLMSLVDIDNRGTPALPLEAVAAQQSPRPSLRDMARRAASNNLRSPVRIADAILRNTPGNAPRNSNPRSRDNATPWDRICEGAAREARGN